MKKIVICALVAAGAASMLVPGTASADSASGPSLVDAVNALTVADEVREGYDRSLFKHWIDEDKDGCNTRKEVLIAEAVVAPAIGANCDISGGQWYSYYDDTYVNESTGLDIDHLVPLAEAWDSGARDWTPAKRMAYANDLGADIPLIAVTARSNRSKADQDPATWMPTSEAARCRYVFEWVSDKTRWGLTIDSAERDVLLQRARACPPGVVAIAPAGV